MAERSSFKTREDWLKYQRDYRAKNRDRIREINKKWRDVNGHGWNDRNKLALVVHRETDRAIKKGILVRQPCEVCGSTEQNRAHHDDYNQPLKVRWFCEKHHREYHKNLSTGQQIIK